MDVVRELDSTTKTVTLSSNRFSNRILTIPQSDCDSPQYNPQRQMSISPRKVQLLFLTVTLLFAGAFGWLGWRLLRQDRALARQRRLEQMEAAADRVSADLYRRLTELEAALPLWEKTGIPDQAVLVRARRGRMEVRPEDGLLYHPLVLAAPGPPASVFADGEAFEFRRNNPAGAAEAFRLLSRSKDPEIRAGALVRLGRNLAKCGRDSEALHAFGELALMGKTPVGGLPAELVGLEARCTLLEKLGRRADLEREARILYERLAHGGWPLSRASYEFKIEEARAWAGEISSSPQQKERAALSAAAEAIWVECRQESNCKGRRFLTVDSQPVLAAWTSDPEGLTALLAPAAAVSSAFHQAGDFRARIVDAEGRLVLGDPEPAGPVRVERAPATTRLPWTLEVTSLDDGSAELAGRQWILAAGLILLVSLLAIVSFFVARAAGKEVAVARLQTDFVSAVSHEFRSPLSSICQISELLNEDRWPSEEYRRRSFEILVRESARLRRLVEGLLDFARMESGAAQYRRELLAPGELVSAVVQEFQAQAASGRHEIHLSVAPKLPDISADREALGRAIWNLLDNAAKYSPDSGSIQAEVTMEGGRLAIRVRDEGVGIPVEEQKTIFQKFVRGSQAKASGVKGTGIGLAMVRHIVEGHGGNIRLESKPWLRQHLHHSAADSEACMTRILVVEDEPGIAFGLEADLKVEGYDVEIVGDGSTAARRALAESFDLILLDVMLPGKDGFEVCRELRRAEVRTPIILLTARTHEAEKVLGLEAGADDYVTKPFSHRELRARIKAVLRRTAGDAPEIFRFGDVEVDFGRGELRRGGRPVETTHLEFKLLTALTRKRGRLLSRDQILDEIWGPGTFVTDRVVDNHVLSLRRKIEPDPQQPRYLISVRGMGYRFEG